MNEVTSQVDMKSDGIRAKMLSHGQNVIIDGVLVKPDPTFHLNHVFQGQKGRDPKTEDQSRDPDKDSLKVRTENEVSDEVKRIHREATEEVARARASSVEPFAPPGSAQAPPATSVEDLKMMVKKNKEKGLVPEATDAEDEENEKKVEQSPKEEEPKDTSLGDDDSLADANDGLDGMMEKEDEDALADDNDVSVAMDETSMLDAPEERRE